MSRVTATDIAAAIDKLYVPSIQVQQIRRDRLWLTEQDEPFYDIAIVDCGTRLVCQVSVHCSPAWAAAVANQLAKLPVKAIDVLTQPFIQNDRGDVLYGPEAETWYKCHMEQRPLLTARFSLRTRYFPS